MDEVLTRLRLIVGVWLALVLGCHGAPSGSGDGSVSPPFEGGAVDAADGGAADAVPADRPPSDAGRDALSDGPAATDLVGDAPARETLLPEVDSGTCAGPCVDKVEAPCPYTGLPCVASVDGGVSIACYSNGVKVYTNQTSDMSFTKSVKKPDGTPCYDIDFSSPVEEYIDYSNGNDVTNITYDYDGVGDDRVTCVGMPAYQFDPSSPVCKAYFSSGTACSAGSCTWP
jgi:hypothetical protein